MKVLYLIDTLSPGGAERSLLAMAPGLAELVDEFVVAVLHDRPGSLRPEFERQGIRVVDVGGQGRATRLPHVMRLIRAERPDVVHTTIFEADTLGRVAAALLRVPVVSSCVSVSYGAEQSRNTGVVPWKLRLVQAIDAGTAKLTRRFHCNAEHLAPFVSANLGVAPGKVVVIPRGRSASEFAPLPDGERERIRQELGLEGDEHFFLALARHEYAKGLDILVEALGHMPDSPPWKLFVAGKQGNMTEGLERAIAELGLESRVRLLGPRDDVPLLLGACDTLVAPSRWEGFCGAVLEGLATGTPVVASNVPGIAEVVGDVPAFLFEPSSGAAGLAEQLVRALEDRATAERASARGRERFLTNFTLEAIVPRMVDELYRPIVA